MSDEFDIVDNLVLNGGLEFAGKDSETGEPLYKPTERLKDIDARLSEDLSAYFSEVTFFRSNYFSEVIFYRSNIFSEVIFFQK